MRLAECARAVKIYTALTMILSLFPVLLLVLSTQASNKNTMQPKFLARSLLCKAGINLSQLLQSFYNLQNIRHPNLWIHSPMMLASMVSWLWILIVLELYRSSKSRFQDHGFASILRPIFVYSFVITFHISFNIAVRNFFATEIF